MLAVALIFVGITLVTNGVLMLGKIDAKTMSFMNIITSIVLVGGNFVELAKATTMTDYSSVVGGFLFGFTYAFIAANLLLGLDTRAYGWYSGMVAVFAIIMAITTIPSGLYNYVYLWVAWALLWGAGFIENALKKPLGKFTPILCIAEGVFATFIPAILMILGKW